MPEYLDKPTEPESAESVHEIFVDVNAGDWRLTGAGVPCKIRKNRLLSMYGNDVGIEIPLSKNT